RRIELLYSNAVKSLGRLPVSLAHFRAQTTRPEADAIRVEELEATLPLNPQLQFGILIEDADHHLAARRSAPTGTPTPAGGRRRRLDAGSAWKGGLGRRRRRRREHAIADASVRGHSPGGLCRKAAKHSQTNRGKGPPGTQTTHAHVVHHLSRQCSEWDVACPP